MNIKTLQTTLRKRFARARQLEALLAESPKPGWAVEGLSLSETSEVESPDSAVLEDHLALESLRKTIVEVQVLAAVFRGESVPSDGRWQ